MQPFLDDVFKAAQGRFVLPAQGGRCWEGLNPSLIGFGRGSCPLLLQILFLGIDGHGSALGLARIDTARVQQVLDVSGVVAFDHLH